MDAGYLIWGIIFVLSGFGLVILGRRFRLNVISYVGIFSSIIGIFVCFAYFYSNYFLVALR